MSTVGIDKYLNDVLIKIYNDQEICKLLLYDDVNPLSHPDISDTTILRTNKDNQRIFVTPFTIETADKTKTTLHIMLNEFAIDPNNMFYEDMTIDFIISCNVRIWELNDGSGSVKLRVNAIWDRLSHIFKRQHTVGLGKNHFSYGRISKFSNYFWGYTYCLKAKNFPIYES